MNRSLRHVLLTPLVLTACPATDDEDTDTDLETGDADACGDGDLDGTEACDFGPDNDDDGNCTTTCELSDQQAWTLSLVALGQGLLDAVGLAYEDAPLGTGAWTPPNVDLNGDGLTKFELTIPLYDGRGDFEVDITDLAGLPLAQVSELPLDAITIADIADIQLDATFPAEQSPAFYLYLYTQPDGTDDQATWYGHRLIAFTADATGTALPDTWTRYSLTGADHRLSLWDAGLDGVTRADAQPLDSLRASGGFDWSTVADGAPSASIDYASEELKFVAIHTSSGAGTTSFDGAVDRVYIELKDGKSLTLDLEP